MTSEEQIQHHYNKIRNHTDLATPVTFEGDLVYNQWLNINEAVNRLRWQGWELELCMAPMNDPKIKILKKPEVETTYEQKAAEYRAELAQARNCHSKARPTDRSIVNVALQICEVLTEPLDQLQLLSFFLEQGFLMSLRYTAPEAMGQRWAKFGMFLDSQHRENTDVISIYNGTYNPETSTSSDDSPGPKSVTI